MCMPLSSCCLCVSLDVGSKIISIVNLIITVGIGMIYGTAAMLPSPVPENRKIVYAIIATVAMVKLLIGCFLIYGVFKKKANLIRPWIAVSFVHCVVLIVMSVFGTVLVMLEYVRDTQEMTEITLMASVYGCYGVILYYFTSVINSRRQQILYEHDYSESAQRLMIYGM